MPLSTKHFCVEHTLAVSSQGPGVDASCFDRYKIVVAVVGDYIYFDGGEISLNNTAQDKYAGNSPP